MREGDRITTQLARHTGSVLLENAARFGEERIERRQSLSQEALVVRQRPHGDAGNQLDVHLPRRILLLAISHPLGLDEAEERDFDFGETGRFGLATPWIVHDAFAL